MPTNKSSVTKISKAIVVYKLILGVIELFLGVGILFSAKILEIYRQYRVRELLENSNDVVVKTIDRLTPFVLQHHLYLTVFLIVLGISKIIGAIGLLNDKEWGLDLLIIIFFIFVPFDLFNLITHPTLLKFIYLLINLFIAFYLIEFQPHKYFRKLQKYFTKEL